MYFLNILLFYKIRWQMFRLVQNIILIMLTLQGVLGNVFAQQHKYAIQSVKPTKSEFSIKFNALHHINQQIKTVYEQAENQILFSFDKPITFYANNLDALQNKALDSVIAKCYKLLDHSPHTKYRNQLFLHIGKSYWIKGQYDNAAAVFDLLRAENNDLPQEELFYWLSKSHLEAEDFTNAIAF